MTRQRIDLTESCRFDGRSFTRINLIEGVEPYNTSWSPKDNDKGDRVKEEEKEDYQDPLVKEVVAVFSDRKMTREQKLSKLGLLIDQLGGTPSTSQPDMEPSETPEARLRRVMKGRALADQRARPVTVRQIKDGSSFAAALLGGRR